MLSAFAHVTPEQLNAMTDEQRKAALEGGLGLAFHKSAVEHVTWIFWAQEGVEPLHVLGQGSAFLLDLGEEIILVTAAHVYRHYLADLAQHGSVDCQIANTRVRDLSKYLIAFGDLRVPLGEATRESDIATFRLPKGAVDRIGKKPIPTSGASAFAPPHLGQQVMFVGYPANERRIVDEGTIEFGSYSALSGVNSITEHQIQIRFDREHMIEHYGTGLPPLGYGLGGMSGGPMLAPECHGAKWSWRLVGIVVEAPKERPPEKVLYEPVIAHRAEYIQPDGRLNKRL
jgi:hypothetical protein